MFLNKIIPIRAKVLYVIDGDTLELAYGFMDKKTTRVRLARVNCNEIKNPKFGKLVDEKGSQEAKAMLKNLVEGKYILFVDDSQPLTYNRLVAWVFGENFADICQKMVSVGLAKVYSGLKKDQLQIDLEKLEDQARLGNLGNWKNSVWQK